MDLEKTGNIKMIQLFPFHNFNAEMLIFSANEILLDEKFVPLKCTFRN